MINLEHLDCICCVLPKKSIQATPIVPNVSEPPPVAVRPFEPAIAELMVMELPLVSIVPLGAFSVIGRVAARLNEPKIVACRR
jgi:hypothetical protein